MSFTKPSDPGAGTLTGSAGTVLDALSLRRRGYATLGLVSVLAASYVYAPWASTGPPLCPLHAVAGLNCPGCGLTRSFCAMAHGCFVEALSHHWLGPLLFTASAVAVPLLLVEIIRQREIVAFHRVLHAKALAYLIATLLVFHWAFKMASETHSGDLTASFHASLLGVAIRWLAG